MSPPNIYVLILFLKFSYTVSFLASTGSLFHSIGACTSKALFPYAFVLGRNFEAVNFRPSPLFDQTLGTCTVTKVYKRCEDYQTDDEDGSNECPP